MSGYPVRIIDDEGVTYWNGVAEMKPTPTSPIRLVFARPCEPTNDYPESSLVQYKTVEAWYERYLGPEDGGPLYIYRLPKVQD